MLPVQNYRRVTYGGVAMVEWLEWHLFVPRCQLSCIHWLSDYKATHIRYTTVVTVYTGYLTIRGANGTSVLL